MNRISSLHRITFLTTVVVSIVSFMALPFSASATVVRPGPTGLPARAITSPFCAAVDTDASTVNARMSMLSTNLNQAWTQQDQKLTATWTKVDQTVAADRQTADSQL